MCLQSDGSYGNCESSEICDGDSLREGVKIDWQSHTSIDNWVGVNRLNLHCVKKERIGLMGTMIFFGWMVAAIFMPRLSDLYGRKIIFLGLLSCQSLIVLYFLNPTNHGPTLTQNTSVTTQSRQ